MTSAMARCRVMHTDIRAGSFLAQQSGRKRNDATSAADMGSFRPANAGVKKGGAKGGSKGGAKGGGKPKGRPGKAKRANMRSKF